MIEFVPLPLIDDFLINYNVGQALLVLFVVAILAVIPMKSRKMLSINVILFGLLFVLTPASLAPLTFKFLGIALLVVGPMLYITAQR